MTAPARQYCRSSLYLRTNAIDVEAALRDYDS